MVFQILAAVAITFGVMRHNHKRAERRRAERDIEALMEPDDESTSNTTHNGSEDFRRFNNNIVNGPTIMGAATNRQHLFRSSEWNCEIPQRLLDEMKDLKNELNRLHTESESQKKRIATLEHQAEQTAGQDANQQATQPGDIVASQIVVQPSGNAGPSEALAAERLQVQHVEAAEYMRFKNRIEEKISIYDAVTRHQGATLDTHGRALRNLNGIAQSQIQELSGINGRISLLEQRPDIPASVSTALFCINGRLDAVEARYVSSPAQVVLQ